MALSGLFRSGEFMSVTVLKAEIISEESENPILMSELRGMSGHKSVAVKTSQVDPGCVKTLDENAFAQLLKRKSQSDDILIRQFDCLRNDVA